MRTKLELQQKQNDLYDVMGNRRIPVIQAQLDAIGFILGANDPITDEDMPVPKTNSDLDNVIKQLGKDKKTVPEYSAFGDHNWENIDAQIEIVRWAKG